MSDLVVGPWTMQGTDAQNAILQPMAEKMAGTLALPDGTFRVKPARVRVLPREQMEWAREPLTNGPTDKGVRAVGYWDGRNIELSEDRFVSPDLARKTFAHEATHQLEDQWMLRSNERAIKPLFEPRPVGFPSEPFAVYGSAAIFGFTNPPYKTFYSSNKIPATNYPKVKEFALRDDHVDPCQPWKDQVASLIVEKANLEAQLADEKTAHEATRVSLEARLAAKDAQFHFIETAVAEGLKA